MPKPRAQAETQAERQLRSEKAKLELRVVRARAALFDPAEKKNPARIQRTAVSPGRVTSGGDAGPAARLFKTSGLSNSYPSTRRERLKDDRAEVLAPADIHLDQTSVEKLSRDAHHLYRSNVLARGLIGRVSDAVAGPQGPNLVFASSSQAFNKAASDLFWKWAGNMPGPQGRFDALNRQTLMSFVRSIPVSWLLDGDLGIVHLTDGSVRIFEGSEIRSPSAGINSAARIANGIEYDEVGAPAAVFVQPTKPGSPYYARTKALRIPWEAFTLLPNPVHRRINQTRGEPGLAAMARYLDLVDDGLDAVTLALRAAAYASLVFSLKDPGSFRASAIAQTAAVDGASNPSTSGAPEEIEWNPLSLITLREGETVTQVKPEHPSQQVENFFRFLVRYAGADAGCPLELALLDSSQTNYHGFKSSVGNAYRGFSWQQFVISEFLVHLTTWRVGMWILDGTLKGAPEDWDVVNWRFQGPPIINPKDEYEAASLAISQRLKTREDALQDLGYTGDLAGLDGRIKVEQDRLRELEIEPTPTPGSPMAAPAASPKPATPTAPKQGSKS